MRLTMVLGTTLAILASSCAQVPKGDATLARQTKVFTAFDGAFQFSHPGNFQVCTKGKIEPCIQSFIPVCEPDALVCVAYPAKEFEGTNFGAASFQVREIHTDREAMTPDVCVTPFPQEVPPGVQSWPEFMISAEHPGEVVGGVLFVHGISGDAATSHSKSVDLYRAFHKQKCFELSVSETETSPAVTDPPMKTLTPAQSKALETSVSQMLHSFRFLK